MNFSYDSSVLHMSRLRLIGPSMHGSFDTCRLDLGRGTCLRSSLITVDWSRATISGLLPSTLVAETLIVKFWRYDIWIHVLEQSMLPGWQPVSGSRRGLRHFEYVLEMCRGLGGRHYHASGSTCGR